MTQYSLITLVKWWIWALWILYFSYKKQKQKAAPNYLKMVSLPMACTPSIQMAVNQYQRCVTWPRPVEVGPFFRDVWTALLTSFVTGNLTKRGSEVWAASSGSETTIFTVWRMLMTSCWELTWRTLRGTSHTLSTIHLRWHTRLIITVSLSENTMAQREIPSCFIGITISQEILWCWTYYDLSHARLTLFFSLHIL